MTGSYLSDTKKVQVVYQTNIAKRVWLYLMRETVQTKEKKARIVITSRTILRSENKVSKVKPGECVWVEEGPLLGLRTSGERNTSDLLWPHIYIYIHNSGISLHHWEVKGPCKCWKRKENFERHISACSGTKCRRALSEVSMENISTESDTKYLHISRLRCWVFTSSVTAQYYTLYTQYIYLNSHCFLLNWSNFEEEEKKMP